jgi:hypothetical protein
VVRHEITRIFHPVGQGAFYSERHVVNGQKFNIVYDCGCFGVRKGRKVVEAAFDGNEIIDILFISHFDYDHISLIPVLINKCQIRKVVLPLLHEEARLVLSGYYRMVRDRRLRYQYEMSLQLLNNPQEFFNGGAGGDGRTNLVFVRTRSESEVMDNPDGSFVKKQEGCIIDSLSEKDAKSLSAFTDWMFLPYNMDYYNRNIILVRELSDWLNQNNYSLQDLNNEKFYEKLLCNDNHRRQLAQIYRNLKGAINENSMLLFSGPMQRQNQCEMKLISRVHSPVLWYSESCFSRQPGCLYSGDFNLKLEPLSKSYGSYFNRIGTVQIPHHGSKRSFDLKTFSAEGRICPVSYGVNNRFKHPDETVIDKIVGAGGCPVCVTNDRFSEFKEMIWL